ncbi:MAG: tetratricopeptide repeat protein [Candidatus Longimicrobiales bacterium M2_2A_002]
MDDTPRDRWRRVEEIFSEAIALPESDREAYLERACGDDGELRREVDSLLRADAAAGGFGAAVEAALGEVAASVHGEPSRTFEGRRIGSYEVRGVLGRGGMGAVYSAVRADDEYRQEVAIKLVRLGADDPRIRRRFLTERQILADLDHPNIARLLDGGTTEDGLPYVVMERVEGEPIDVYCDRRGLSIDDRLRLFVRVCEAVQFAHRSLVVHRDIKPGNILVTDDGVPKLLDFGIAKLLDVPPGTAHTRTAARLMTPEYASPEQVRGETITTASDVYSLGVLLYELLTGRRPYRLAGRTPRETERAITEEEPERPSAAVTRAGGEAVEVEGAGDGSPQEVAAARGTTPHRLRRRLRGDLDKILLMSLRKEPGRRYASVEGLAEDIRRHLDGLPVRARPDSVGYRLGKFVRRHRVGVAGTAAALVVVAGLTAFYTARLAAERDRARAEAEKAERVVGFLTGLFEAADPYEARGRELTAGELLDAGAGRIERELADQPELRATMLGVIGGVYESLGLYEEAGPFLEGALELRRAEGDAGPLPRAEAMHDLAGLARDLGDYERADSLLLAAQELRRAELDPPHVDLVATLNGLGMNAFHRGDYARADSVLREATDMGRRLPPSEANIETLVVALANLGRTQSRQGNHAEAETVLREALERARAGLGEDHPGVGYYLDALAETLRLQGKPAEAVALFREAVEHGERILGADHPSTTVRLSNLAVALQNLDRHDEAIEILTRVLEHQRDVYDPDHDKLATTLNNLAASYVAKEALDEAERLYRRSLEIRRGTFGDDHPEVATTLNNLAHVAADRRDFAGALDYQRQALAIDRETLSEDHPYIGQDLVLIGIYLLGDGQVEAAGEPLRHGSDMIRSALGADHPAVAEGLHNLARYFLATGQLDKAERTVREALRIRRTALDADNWLIALSQTLLGEVLAARGSYAEAEPLLVNGYDAVRAGTTENSRHRELARQRVVEFFRSLGEPARAEAVPP